MQVDFDPSFICQSSTIWSKKSKSNTKSGSDRMFLLDFTCLALTFSHKWSGLYQNFRPVHFTDKQNRWRKSGLKQGFGIAVTIFCSKRISPKLCIKTFSTYFLTILLIHFPCILPGKIRKKFKRLKLGRKWRKNGPFPLCITRPSVHILAIFFTILTFFKRPVSLLSEKCSFLLQIVIFYSQRVGIPHQVASPLSQRGFGLDRSQASQKV